MTRPLTPTDLFVVECPDEFAAQFDRVETTAEHPGEGALDEVFQPTFESLDTHGAHDTHLRATRRSTGSIFPPCSLRSGCAQRPSNLYAVRRKPRASGGIGRRAGFRFQCPKGREGSSPSSRTTQIEPAAGPATTATCVIGRGGPLGRLCRCSDPRPRAAATGAGSVPLRTRRSASISASATA
jgi:hypothetical protein